MATVPAQIRDEFEPSPIEDSVLRKGRMDDEGAACRLLASREIYTGPCLRQFGMVQEIPLYVDTDDALHAIDMRGKIAVNWRNKHYGHIQVASHKQMLTNYTVGNPMYKHISAVLKYVKRLHRITAQLPLKEIDGANPDAVEDTGRPSTSSNRASHSHGQHGAPHQVVSRLDPPPPPHASPAPEFPPPPHASPAPEFPPLHMHLLP
nr:hypothetical protein CFP56_12767 [Quercus suber]